MEKGVSNKLRKRWIGPYKVIEKLSDANYKVKPINRRGKGIVVNIRRLKRCFYPSNKSKEDDGRIDIKLEKDDDTESITRRKDDNQLINDIRVTKSVRSEKENKKNKKNKKPKLQNKLKIRLPAVAEATKRINEKNTMSKKQKH